MRYLIMAVFLAAGVAGFIKYASSFETKLIEESPVEEQNVSCETEYSFNLTPEICSLKSILEQDVGILIENLEEQEKFDKVYGGNK